MSAAPATTSHIRSAADADGEHRARLRSSRPVRRARCLRAGRRHRHARSVPARRWRLACRMSPLLDRLVTEKLKAEAETIAAEGWKWIFLWGYSGEPACLQDARARGGYGRGSPLKRASARHRKLRQARRAARTPAYAPAMEVLILVAGVRNARAHQGSSDAGPACWRSLANSSSSKNSKITMFASRSSGWR